MSKAPQYEYKQINTRDICVDDLYQREVNQAKIRKIIREYNPYLVNAIKVSFRNGKYWVFDGQHTIAAIKARNNGRDCRVDCKVFYGLTWLEEVELFIAQNGASTAVSIRDKMRAMYNSGDPEITGMVTAAYKAGLMVDFEPTGAKNRILAVSTLLKAYKLLDENDFISTLKIIKESWGGSPESLVGDIIGGMSVFYLAYRDDFNRSKLVSKLSRKSPIEIVRDGKVSRTSGYNRFARVILGIYNTGTRTNRLEDRL